MGGCRHSDLAGAHTHGLGVLCFKKCGYHNAGYTPYIVSPGTITWGADKKTHQVMNCVSYKLGEFVYFV